MTEEERRELKYAAMHLDVALAVAPRVGSYNYPNHEKPMGAPDREHVLAAKELIENVLRAQLPPES
jgi:hypothetical protein